MLRNMKCIEPRVSEDPNISTETGYFDFKSFQAPDIQSKDFSGYEDALLRAQSALLES
jgi:hypothetical protein